MPHSNGWIAPTTSVPAICSISNSIPILTPCAPTRVFLSCLGGSAFLDSFFAIAVQHVTDYLSLGIDDSDFSVVFSSVFATINAATLFMPCSFRLR